MRYNDTDLEVGMQSNWRFLVEDAGVKVTIFSGDDDSICGGVGTQSWLWDMGYDVKAPWAPWADADGQLGGYATRFAPPGGAAFSYVTVHSAGHEVPAYEPSRALHVLRRFLSDDF